MVKFDQLHEQNHKITELSNVFQYLIRERAMCDTECARTLFAEYTTKVREHIEIVDQLCGKLISNPEQSARNTAKGFLSGSSEIKRIFAGYLKDWCAGTGACKELAIRDHAAFVTDTDQMFSLVLDRIQRETEHLYPLIRKLESARPSAEA